MCDGHQNSLPLVSYELSRRAHHSNGFLGWHRVLCDSTEYRQLGKAARRSIRSAHELSRIMARCMSTLGLLSVNVLNALAISNGRMLRLSEGVASVDFRFATPY